MPNYVYKWDFEDGTTQGWSLGPDYVVLDDTGAVQGTYSIKYSRPSSVYPNDLVASISSIDLSNTSRPLLLMVIRDTSGSYANFPGNIKLTIRDSSGAEIYSSEVMLAGGAYDTQWYKVVVFDLIPVAGQSGLTLSIYETGRIENSTRVHYYDMIAIVDGCDSEWQASAFIPAGGGVTFDLSLSDDVSSLNTSHIGLAVGARDITSDSTNPKVVNSWQATLDYIDKQGNTGSFSLGSLIAATWADVSNQVQTVTGFKGSVATYNGLSGYQPEVARAVAALLDDSLEYQKIYCVTMPMEINALSPQNFNVVHVITYGTQASGSKTVSMQFGVGSSLDLAPYVEYIQGSHSDVTSGSVTLEVYSSDGSTLIGSSSVDLTASDQITGDYITGLQPGQYQLKWSWSITANANVSLKLALKTKVTL